MYFDDRQLLNLHIGAMHQSPQRFQSFACHACKQVFNDRMLLGMYHSINFALYGV